VAPSKSEGQPDQKQIETLIKTVAGKTFESIPKSERPKVAQIVGSVVFQSSIQQFSGPLPPPEHLREYEQIVPGAAERLIKMAEDQSVHRRGLENRVIDAQIRQSDRGQWMAVAVAMLFLAGSIWVTLAGFPWVGSILGGTTVASLVGIFITSKWQQKKDLEQKRSGSPRRR
jgi:uncharacterized membrane protein